MIGENCKFCPDMNQTKKASIMGFQYIASVRMTLRNLCSSLKCVVNEKSILICIDRTYVIRRN